MISKSMFSNIGDPKSVFPNRCFRFFRETVIPQIGVPEIGDPNRCSRFGVPVSSLKRCSRKSVLSFPLKRWSRNRCSEIGGPKSVFPNRCFRFFRETVIPKICVTGISGPQSEFSNRCFRFLGTILLHTLGYYQPMSASRTSVGETLNTSPDNRSVFR